MVSQGRLSRLHDVSTDRIQWRRAGEVPSLYPPRGFARRIPEALVAEHAVTADVPTARPVDERARRVAEADTLPWKPPDQASQPLDEPAAKDDREWYYSRGGGVEGPCSSSVIARLIAEGQLGLNDQVNPGPDASGWQPIGSMTEFAAFAPPQSGADEAVAGSPEGRLAASSLKLGLIGIAVPICGLIALIYGLNARSPLNASGDHSGARKATAGIALGVLDICLDILRLGVLLYLAATFLKRFL